MRLLLDAICREQLSVGSSRPRWLTAHMGRRLRAPAGCGVDLSAAEATERIAQVNTRRPTQSRPPPAEHTHTHMTNGGSRISFVQLTAVRVCFLRTRRALLASPATQSTRVQTAGASLVWLGLSALP